MLLSPHKPNMAETPSEIFPSGKGVDKSAPTPNNPVSLTAAYLTDGITALSKNGDLLKMPLYM